MKTARLILAAAMLPLLFACAKENAVVDEEKPGGDTEKTEKAEYRFTVVASGDIQPQEALAKASFDDEDGVVWVAGGKAGIVAADTADEDGITDEDGTTAGGSAVSSDALSTISEDGYDASFSFTAEAGSYRLFYPYNAESSYNSYKFEVPAVQESAPGKSADIFALVGTEDLALSENATVANAKMNVVGSYIFFQVYGKAGETVQSIGISSQNTKTAGVYCADNDGSLVGTPEGDSDVTVSLSSEYVTTEGKDDAKGIYAAVLPVKSQNTYTVTTDWGTYTFESSEEKEFKMGSIKPVPLNLTKATSAPDYAPHQLYIIGDATSVGWVLENAIAMTTSDGGKTFSCETVLQTGTARAGFKFLKWNNSWADVYVNDNGKLKFYADAPSPDDDKKFTVSEAGKYRITANFVTREVTTELIEEYPEILYQIADGNAMYIDIMQEDGNGGHVAKILIGKESGYHDFKIRQNGKYWHVDNQYPEINFNDAGNVDALSRGYDVIYDDNSSLGWWINDVYSEKYYDIALNTTTNKVTVTLSQGKKFYLIGINKDWKYPYNAEYEAEADGNGIVQWNVTVTQECDFKIYGENMVSDDFFGKGEWYQSQLPIADPQNDIWSWNSGAYGTETPVLFGKSGDYNRKWKMTETGSFTIVFDTVNLKLKVTKND